MVGDLGIFFEGLTDLKLWFLSFFWKDHLTAIRRLLRIFLEKPTGLKSGFFKNICKHVFQSTSDLKMSKIRHFFRRTIWLQRVFLKGF